MPELNSDLLRRVGRRVFLTLRLLIWLGCGVIFILGLTGRYPIQGPHADIVLGVMAQAAGVAVAWNMAQVAGPQLRAWLAGRSRVSGVVVGLAGGLFVGGLGGLLLGAGAGSAAVVLAALLWRILNPFLLGFLMIKIGAFYGGYGGLLCGALAGLGRGGFEAGLRALTSLPEAAPE